MKRKNRPPVSDREVAQVMMILLFFCLWVLLLMQINAR